MSDGKLIVVDARDRYSGYSICWFFPETGDEGGILGDMDRFSEAKLVKAKPGDRAHILATLTAGKTEGVSWDPRQGYTWESRVKATKALAAVKFALKNDTGAPWPEWAVKAKAAGWKAPKGWKP
jgi:hypothetical protein